MIHSKLQFFRERNTREKATSKIRLHPALKSRLHHANLLENVKKKILSLFICVIFECHSVSAKLKYTHIESELEQKQ